jgi:hypothetical protein
VRISEFAKEFDVAVSMPEVWQAEAALRSAEQVIDTVETFLRTTKYLEKLLFHQNFCYHASYEDNWLPK